MNEKFSKEFKKILSETLFNEEEAGSFVEKFEISPEVFKAFQQIAREKDLVLSDFELKTPDNRVLVDLSTEDAFEQILTYLELEYLKDSPTRTITINDVMRANKEEKTSNTKNIQIIASAGAGEIPTSEEFQRIIAANLKVLQGTLAGKAEVIKAEDKIVARFMAAFEDPNVTDEEIKKNIGTNLDKIFQIEDIVVK